MSDSSEEDNDQSSSIHENLPRDRKNKNLFDKFEVMASLGQGSMGAVSMVRIKPEKVGGSAFVKTKKGVFGLKAFQRQKRTGQLTEELKEDHVFALKSIATDRVSETFLEELQNEINIVRSLDHPNIVRLFEVYTCHKQIYMVLELCDGGDLYTRSPYSEREAALICSQVVSAVVYLHSNGVVHRDLKYENIMFENTSKDARVKIIDFGLSKKFLGPPKLMAERVGTIYTMAPQVLQGIYSSKADLWSIGVIAYMLLCSSKPFYHKDRRLMVDMIMRADYHTDDNIVWGFLSDDAKDFVSKLLVVNPKDRMNAEQALRHPWIVNREQLTDEKPSPDLLESIDDCLLNFVHMSAVKRLALTVIAHRSRASEIVDLRKAFEEFDVSRDGVLTFEEFKTALKKCNISEDDVKKVYSSVDINKNGMINYTEFLAATIEAHGSISEDKIAECFDRLDADEKGYISKKNLREVLGKRCSQEDIDAIMASGDTNCDGKISYQEFLNAFRQRTYTHMAEITLPGSDNGSISSTTPPPLLGLNAKIPGGKFDTEPTYC